MRLITLAALAGLASLAACVEVTVAPQSTSPAAPAPQTPSSSALASFRAVAARVEPVAEAECRSRTRGGNCDFDIIIDTRPDLPANAYQTLDRYGRPVLAFTTAMLGDLRNEDEIAFVLSHEAAHHIEGHIPRSQQNAMLGALVATGLAAAAGAEANTIRAAQDLGAQAAVLNFSRGYELDADRLGTVIAKRAGYDPVNGAAFFTRIPDPRNRFLASHPPNGERITAVRNVARGL
ncbi:MAG: M48 family metallopeptidase [Roseivivax sp.]|nr:M48 family metallopeptidase [Roseivivax sp.]